MRPTSILLELALCALVAACSPVTGARCRAELLQCGAECVDPMRDPRHCGGCGLACEDGQACWSGTCVVARDAGPLDASIDPLSDAAAIDDGGGSGPCDEGELRCGDRCVRPGSDPSHCGACDTACEAGSLCVAGVCGGACGAPLRVCDERCVDLRSDPDHCGDCGRACDSGACVEGLCERSVAGHVLLVGHDRPTTGSGAAQIIANAVFMGRGRPVRVLAFEGDPAPDTVQRVDAALDAFAESTGRSWHRVAVRDAASVTVRLAEADVLLLYPQPAHSPALVEWGALWSRALRTFLARGGVLVALDGAGSATHRILVGAGVLEVSGHVDVTGVVLTVVAATDAAALGVPLRYRAEASTVRFAADPEGLVVSDGSGPVVIHRTMAPGR